MEYQSEKRSLGGAGKLVAAVILTALFLLVAIASLSSVMGIGIIPYTVIDERLSVDVRYADGTDKHYDSNYFSPARYGDVIEIDVPLSAGEKKDGMALCFNVYNSIVDITTKDGRNIYSYGHELSDINRQIGHLIVFTAIPEEAWGSSLKITILPEENSYTTSLTDVCLMNAIDARLYSLVGNQFDLFIFVPLCIFAGIGIIGFGIAYLLGSRKIEQGLFLCFFLFAVSCWYIGFQGLFYLLSDNTEACATIEYLFLYLLMIPCLAYMRRERLPKTSRIILSVFEAVFIIIAAIIIPLNYSIIPVTFSTFLNPFRIFMIISLITAIIILFIIPKEKLDTSEKTLRYGLIGTSLFGIMETVRAMIGGFIDISESPFLKRFVDMNFSRFMILVFLLSLFFSYILRAMNTLKSEMEKKQLSILAYRDLLTDIPNRQDCERKANAMSEEEVKKCAVIFLDANDLKKANDTYGHKCGDELLIQVGKALEYAMEGISGFFGRYGGDEYVACTYDRNDADKVCVRFHEYIDLINREKRLPFDVSAAVGTVFYDEVKEMLPEENTSTIQTMIRVADEKMYQNKVEMKKTRKDLGF